LPPVLSSHTAELHGNFNDSGTDDHMVDLTILASGRDTILADVDHDNDLATPRQGNFKITNSGALDVTDAYVIASADELYLRDEWTADTHAASYANPEPYQIEVENASLALASVDTMHLINVDITTQGSLAIGTLDDLNLRSTRPSDDNVFRVGHEGVRNEGLFLYASNVLSLEDLSIEGKIDDIYMEATTINLKDVTFPASAAVLLRSQLGGINFGGQTDGKVNMHNVKHLGISTTEFLNSNHFNSSLSKSKKSTSSGRPYIEVQAWGSGG
jgi:FlaG/FlaF family flagellin (archaellin)